ncbi:MAG: methylated-DNA--[protein]-cysteine S-methyltransferase [Chloroflexota bacterium]|nr:methylated-DNA--[protein]-cysteine S-methyltransferase [Chloroflexota bacterium]
MFSGRFESPIGLVQVEADMEALISVSFVEASQRADRRNLLIDGAIDQLAQYFQGSRREFDLPLQFQGTEFQQAVWQQLMGIPYGRMVSYQDIANALDNPGAVRAVGAANGQNPISIIVPCHRVVGSDGSLTGYGSGLWRKEWLLRHEGSLLL